VRVHSLTLFALFALPGACDVTPRSTSRPATSQPPCLGRKPNARVAIEREVFFFPFAARDRRRKLHRERAVFFFPFAAKDRRRKLHRERAVFFFLFLARDKKRKLHREWVLKARPYVHVVGSV
jgi:hypothetical protein